MVASFPKVPKTQRPKVGENPLFRLPHCRLTPPLQGTPATIGINLILPESRVIGLHLRHRLCRSIFIKLSWWAPKRRTCFETECVMALQGHPRSLILATIESAYATFYWSPIGPILPCFRYIAGFLRRATPPLFHPNFRGVPLMTRLPMLWLRGRRGAKTLSKLFV